jgi:hypothetical protein
MCWTNKNAQMHTIALSQNGLDDCNILVRELRLLGLYGPIFLNLYYHNRGGRELDGIPSIGDNWGRSGAV